MEKINELLKHTSPDVIEDYIEKITKPYHDECIEVGNTIKKMIDEGVIKGIRLDKDGKVEIIE